MGCSNCSNGGGVPNGCKSNGSCGTSGCDKLSVFDWLADIDLPNGQSEYDVVEVRFKSSRKGFYRNIKGINLQVGDAVVVESSPGYDVGVVSIVGELARIQVRKKTSNFKAHEARAILRKAAKADIEKWKTARSKESDTMHASRRLASELGLKMKISDVEFQGDGNKATFYYTADERVDFRQLIRNMAEEFRVKIEMKQIGVRQEAARLGGIGSCGRELCCSTWLTDFRSVSTASARYQQLSLNPQKLAGQCGKLKCCLNYELDAYMEALKKFPRSDIKLKTKKGTAFHVKTDVFKEQMWYIQEDKDNPGANGFIPLTPERVAEIIKLNKAGEYPQDLKDFMVEIEVEAPDYTDVVGQDSLNRFEHVFKRKKKKRRNKNNNRNRANNQQKQASNTNKQNTGGQNKPKASGGGQQKNRPNQNKKRGNQSNQKLSNQNKPQNQKANNKQQNKPNNQEGNKSRPNNTKRKPSGNRNNNRNKQQKPKANSGNE
ncbi:MAG: PSP1 domain-containing protein [Crocinitomicaceae bacterium]